MIAIITQQQAEQLSNTTYNGTIYFNPIQDINDNWIVSQEEINQSDLQWLKDLPLKEYEPKIINLNIL